jgi:hypothetical protein
MCTHVHACTRSSVPTTGLYFILEYSDKIHWWLCYIQQPRATKYCWHLEIQDPGKTQSLSFTLGRAMKNTNDLKSCLMQITSQQQIFMGLDCLKWWGLVTIQLAGHILINKLLIMSIFTPVGNVLLNGSGKQHENHSDSICSQLKYIS